jgi:hypothetical protein
MVEATKFESVLMARYGLGPFHIEAAKMKKHQRLAIHQPLLPASFHLAMTQIPIGHIAGGIPKDFHAGKESGRKIHPPLIYEQAARQVHTASGLQAGIATTKAKRGSPRRRAEPKSRD